MRCITIKYDGYDADTHSLDLRLLGKSIGGMERVFTSGLIAIEHKRWIRKQEQLPILLKAKQPERGSFELPIFFGSVAGVLPLIHQALAEKIHEAALSYFRWIMNSYLDHKQEATSSLSEVVEFMLQTQDRNRLSQKEVQEFCLETLDKSLSFAKDIVAPIGDSCETLEIGSNVGNRTILNIESAEKIRALKDIQITELKDYKIRIDGLVIHNRRLQVELVGNPGFYVPAEVRDPVYDELPNPYMEAIQAQRIIVVKAKAELKAGEIKKLYIMSFEGDNS
jgi:hypothetical protein